MRLGARRAFVTIPLLLITACTADDGAAVDESGPADDPVADQPSSGSSDEAVSTAEPIENETASVEDFCAGISAIRSADFELDQTFSPEARALFDDVRSAAPPEIADEVDTVISALDAIAEIGVSSDDDDLVAFDAAAEILLDPAYVDANERLAAFTSDACGIDLDEDSSAEIDLGGIDS